MSLAASAYTIADQERMARATNYFAWQHSLIGPELGRRVVEVGCGLGNYTGRLLPGREVVIALDTEAGCIERLRERYPNQPNLETLVCDAASGEFLELARFHPDSCVCLNVLEHTADDRQVLGAMQRILRPGGVIVLLAPAFQSLYGPIDRHLGHYRRYTRRSLGGLAEACGLQVRTLRYMNAAGFFGWWLNARVLKLEAQSERQIAVFDRLVVPAMWRVERVATPPFGQSVLAVLRKP